jgi:hypothetical protein
MIFVVIIVPLGWLFNGVVSSETLQDQITGCLMNWKGLERKQLCSDRAAILESTCSERGNKIKGVNKGSRYCGRVSITLPPKYQSRALPLDQLHSNGRRADHRKHCIVGRVSVSGVA